MVLAGDGVLFPDHLAGDRVERDQPPVISADKHLALPERDAAIDDVAAAPIALLAIDLRIVGPEPLAGAGVDGVHHAPRRGLVHDAVDHDRRRLDAAGGFERIAPDQTELLDVVGVDLVQLAEAGFGVVETDGRPVVRRRRVGLDRGAIDCRSNGLDVIRRSLCLGECARAGNRKAEPDRGRKARRPMQSRYGFRKKTASGINARRTYHLIPPSDL